MHLLVAVIDKNLSGLILLFDCLGERRTMNGIPIRAGCQKIPKDSVDILFLFALVLVAALLVPPLMFFLPLLFFLLLVFFSENSFLSSARN